MAKEQDDELQQRPDGEGAVPEPAESRSIKVGPDADDDGADDAGPRQGDPQRTQDRRQQFGAMKKELRAEREARTKLEQEMAELRGRVSAPQPVVIREPAQQRQAAPDPAEAAIEALEAQQQAVLTALTTPGLNAEAQAKFTKQWQTLDRQRHKAIAQQAAAELGGSRGARAPTSEDMDAAAAKQILTSEFPKVMESAYYKSLAIAEANRIAAEARQEPNLTHARAGAALVYQRHNLGTQKAPPVSAETRAKYEATGTRPSTSSAGDTWTPTKLQYRHAMSYTEHRKGLSDEQRLRAWYNEVAKPNKLV